MDGFEGAPDLLPVNPCLVSSHRERPVNIKTAERVKLRCSVALTTAKPGVSTRPLSDILTTFVVGAHANDVAPLHVIRRAIANVAEHPQKLILIHVCDDNMAPAGSIDNPSKGDCDLGAMVAENEGGLIVGVEVGFVKGVSGKVWDRAGLVRVSMALRWK